MSRQYHSNSLVGKICRWTLGGHLYWLDTTCDVRRTLLFSFPAKLLLYPTVRGIDIPMWLVWITLFQIWSLFNMGRYLGDGGDPVSIFGWVVATAGKILVLEILGIGFALVVGILKFGYELLADNVNLPKIRAPKTAMRTKEIIADLWDDVYHKVCKHVEWVD